MGYQQRTDGGTKAAFIIGLVLMIAVSVLCYIFGSMHAGSMGFKDHAGFALNSAYKSVYLRQMISVLIPAILYSVAFWQVDSKTKNHGSLVKTDNSSNYVFKNWLMFTIISGVGAVVLAVILFNFVLFGNETAADRGVLIKYNLWWVWALQGVLSMVIFALPFCKPLKKAN